MNDQHLERMQGSIEHVTFHSEETGFCVLRTKIKGHRDLVTVIGTAASITAGEYIECVGSWINDKKHGLQFKTQQLKVVPPTTLEGIEKYLGSGMVKGIGPHFAKKLVKAFGENVFNVIEEEPHRLTSLEGIGEKRKQSVIDSWAEQKSIRNIMAFLHSHGVGTARSVRIYKTYGDSAVEKIQENPYRLALDIRGIGFKTADALAQRLGISKDSPLRAQAGVRHALQEMCNHGHCAAEHENLVSVAIELLGIATPIIEEAIAHEVSEKHLIADTIENKNCIFLAALYQAETVSAQRLQKICQGAAPWGTIDCDKAIPWVEEKTHLQLSDSQRNAIQTVLQNKVSIITGGPGVGKTTIVNSLLKIILAKRFSIALCAPTGRAAKRLSETTGQTAKTIHRLLDYNPKTHTFKHNQDLPLPIDVLVVDESSMIDILLLSQLLKAVPNHAAIIFVGDIDQLPSVGAGAVLSDLIRSGVISTVRLTEIFRQAESSKIIVNAHRINCGQMPMPNDESSDFYTIYADTPEAIHKTLIELVEKRIPNHYHCNPVADIQVLTPMNRGGLGSRALNADLQKQLNASAEPKVTRFGTTFAPGDKVIQMVNNYDKEVFNGDIGFITQVNSEDRLVQIRFDQRQVDYDFNELDEINLAYAISIHKSQGSEFPIVIMPLSTQHYTLLARNLLYTGVTRGKKLVILVGQKKAIGMAVKNNKEASRLTKLAQRLREAEA